LKRILAIIVGILAFLALVVLGAILVMPKDDLAALVQPLPVVGAHADAIVDFKSNITDSASHMVDDAVYSVTSTWREIASFSLADKPQRVVIELEPIRNQAPRMPQPPSPPVVETPPPTGETMGQPGETGEQPHSQNQELDQTAPHTAAMTPALPTDMAPPAVEATAPPPEAAAMPMIASDAPAAPLNMPIPLQHQ